MGVRLTLAALAAVRFDAERCVLFYRSQVLLWKRGVTALLKPEPSSDVFVDLWRGKKKPHNDEQFLLSLPFLFLILFSPYIYQGKGLLITDALLFQ